MSRRAVAAALCTAALVATAALAAPPSPAQIQPSLKDSRTYLDSWSFWVQGDDGATLFASVLLSNLAGTPTRPGVSFTCYDAAGTPLRAEAESPAEGLRIGGPPLDVAFEAGRLSVEGGAYHLTARAPATRRGSPAGHAALDLRLVPGAPGHVEGDGHVPVGEDTFWLGVLFPTGRAQGTLTVTPPSGAPRVITLAGAAYGDHSWQDAWAQKIATRWVNYRFFSAGPTVAVTTWTTPGQQALSRGVLAEGGRVVATSAAVRVEGRGGSLDAVSGYNPPRQLAVEGGALGRIDVDLGAPLDRLDLLAGVNPMARQVVEWFVAKPWTYRYRVPATLQLPGTPPRVVPGTLVVEVVYVTE